MDSEFVIAADESCVQAWSSFRLPFEPRDAKKRFRDELRAALLDMHLAPDQSLHAVYSSVDRSMSDVENILLYNVGMSSFRQHMKNGITMERSFHAPPSGVNDTAWAHHHLYAGVAARPSFASWAINATIAYVPQVVPPTRVEAPAQWWAAVKAAEGITGQPTTDLFALDVVWHPQEGRRPSLHTALKPMLDGVIAAFHSHDGTALEDLAYRLSRVTALDPDKAAHWLVDAQHAALSQRRLLWPFRDGVQWNPADDLCVAARVEIGEPTPAPHVEIKLMSVVPTAQHEG